MTPNQEIIIAEALGYPGKLLSYSKSLYCRNHPDNEVFFNANLFTESLGKIWYGDIDVTKNIKLLEILANDLGEPLYVLREMDGRFGAENLPWKELAAKAVAVISN